MKTRRGSSYWSGGDGDMISQFEAGDIVNPVGVAEFIGVVRDVQSKINKVFVAWGGGTISQHDPDEIQLSLHQTELVKSRMSSDRVFVETRRGAKISSDFFAGADEPEQYVGDPRTHGLDTPRGGGFSIMQNLQKDLAPEALAESEKGPLVSPPETDDMMETDGGDQNAPDGDMNAPQEVVASEDMVSRSGGYVAADSIDRAGMKRAMKDWEVSRWDDGDEFILTPYPNTRSDWKTVRIEGSFPRGNKVGVSAKWKVYMSVWKNNAWKAVSTSAKKFDKDDVSGMLAYLKKMAKSSKTAAEVESSEELRSRRAMYWMDKGRTYRLTKNEQGADGATCPKCKKDMSKEKFTKSEKLFSCPECGFKVPSSKVLTERRVEVEIEPDGSIEVEIEPASSRRGSRK